MAFCEREFELNEKVGDETLRDNLNAVYRQTGKMPDKLKNDCPDGMRYLYSHFCQLFTGDVLSYTEIKSYSELMGLNLTSFEVDVIKQIERKWHGKHR